MTSPDADPVHVALKYLAIGCIDENLVDEAEALVAFLEPLGVAPHNVALVQIWALSERHHLREALRRCEEQVEQTPLAEEFQSLLGLLRYLNNEPSWRPVCERLVDSPTALPDSKRLAASLLDGSFAKAKPKSDVASTTGAVAEAPAPAIDYTAFGAYMRA